LVQRLVRALTRPGELVVDPFMGSGTSAVAAAVEGRRFAGCDVKRSYVKIAQRRTEQIGRGKINYRPIEKPIHEPNGNEAVAIRPPHVKQWARHHWPERRSLSHRGWNSGARASATVARLLRARFARPSLEGSRRSGAHGGTHSDGAIPWYDRAHRLV
jgi:hypothetical protein